MLYLPFLKSRTVWIGYHFPFFPFLKPPLITPISIVGAWGAGLEAAMDISSITGGASMTFSEREVLLDVGVGVGRTSLKAGLFL
ncbi:hypothetical protein D3C80_1906630 [compost metagenome]